MKIYTNSFKKYGQISSLISEKGNYLTESYFVNFNDSYVYFRNSNSTHGRFKFRFELEPGEDLSSFKNFYLDIDYFKKLTSKYDVLNYKDFTFSVNRDSFKIPYLCDEKVNFDKSIFDETYESSGINFTPELQKNITEALSFADTNTESSLNGVFFQNKKIISGEGSAKVYVRKNESLSKDYSIPYNFIKFLSLFKDYKDIKIDQTENRLCLNVDSKECEIISSKNNNLEIFNVDDPDTQAVFNHNTHVVVNLVDFYNAMSSVNEFTNPGLNYRFKLLVKDQNTIELRIEETNCKVTKTISLNTACDVSLVDKYYWLNSNIIHTALKLFKNDNLMIQLPIDDNTGVNFRTLDNNDLYVFVIKMEDC